MSMYIKITTDQGKLVAVKRNDIRRVYSNTDTTKCVVSFVSPKINNSVSVNKSVGEFYEEYLA